MMKKLARVAWIALLPWVSTWTAPKAEAQPVVSPPYQGRLVIETALASAGGAPTQMAWGPLARLYVMYNDAGIVSYRYNWITGKLSDPVAAVPSARGIGLGFHGSTLYYSTMSGSLVKATDDNGNGVYGETGQGELSVEIVRGIPVGDHAVDQIQIVGDTLFVGIGRRTINGRRGPLSGGVIDDFGGNGFFSGGQGNSWGDSAYNGAIAWIKDLNQVGNFTDSANAFTTLPAVLSRELIQGDAGPITNTSPGKLTVHSSGTRNPFGLCLDASGRLYFTNNFNRAITGGDGTTVQDIARDDTSAFIGNEVHDQFFLAVAGADYGYADENWRGVSPMLPIGARGSNRLRSITFDNLANPGPYPLHNPAEPAGLGPSCSADGCAFFYAPTLPAELLGNVFIARYNPSVADHATPPNTLVYSDIVAVDVSTGAVKRVAHQFHNPLALISDGANRLLIGDFSVPGNPGGTGAIYALRAVR